MNNRRRQKLKYTKGTKLTKLQIWNLRQTFAVYIAGGLRQFMNREINGFPSDLLKDDDENADHEAAAEEWRDILEKMIWSFESIARHEDTPVMKWYLHKCALLEKEGFSAEEILFESKLPTPPAPVWKMDIEHGKRLQHGIDLFAKYFLDLWN